MSVHHHGSVSPTGQIFMKFHFWNCTEICQYVLILPCMWGWGVILCLDKYSILFTVLNFRKHLLIDMVLHDRVHLIM